MANKTALSQAEACFRTALDRQRVENRPLAVALSGGADSVLLFFLSLRFVKENGGTLFAIHVHHGIRGAAADRDADFVSALCQNNGVPLSLFRKNAPAFAASTHCGMEEAARYVRYEAFSEFLHAHSDAVILTAHHAGDNLETFLLHLFRGSGLSGLCGIPERRDAFLRPLLAVGKPEILSALSELSSDFVTDETNLENICRRNRLRNEVIPRLAEIFPRPELRLAESISLFVQDEDFLQQTAKEAYRKTLTADGLDRKIFSEWHPAVASRVLRRFVESLCGYSSLPTQKQTESVIHLARLGDTDFCVDLSGGVTLLGDRKELRIRSGSDMPDPTVYPVSPPIFCSPDRELLLRFLPKEESNLQKTQENFIYRQNVYRLLKQIFLSCDTMENGICIRHRRSGDSYRFGGMTHKLATLLSDRKLSTGEKDRLWLLCDQKGIIWFPGGSVRDGEGGGDTVVLCYGLEARNCRQKGYLQNEDQF